MREFALLAKLPKAVRHLIQHVKDHGVMVTCQKAFTRSYHTLHSVYFLFVWIEGHGLYAMAGGALFVLSCVSPFLALSEED